MTFYKRHLPHWQPEEAEFFITFRLAGSLPKDAVNKLKVYRNQLEKKKEFMTIDKLRRKIFEKYEDLLDSAGSSPTWLKEEKIAHIVQGALHFYDNKDYNLYAYCLCQIMCIWYLNILKGEK